MVMLDTPRRVTNEVTWKPIILAAEINSNAYSRILTKDVRKPATLWDIFLLSKVFFNIFITSFISLPPIKRKSSHAKGGCF